MIEMRSVFEKLSRKEMFEIYNLYCDEKKVPENKLLTTDEYKPSEKINHKWFNKDHSYCTIHDGFVISSDRIDRLTVFSDAEIIEWMRVNTHRLRDMNIQSVIDAVDDVRINLLGRVNGHEFIRVGNLYLADELIEIVEQYDGIRYDRSYLSWWHDRGFIAFSTTNQVAMFKKVGSETYIITDIVDESEVWRYR